MKITTLLENTASRNDMLTEHGLSLYIETDTHRILFDMGQSDAFLKNAATLGVDLTRVDLAVLSHGHYDHGGGLGTFLSVNDRAPVYVNRHSFEPYYNGQQKYIGLDLSLEAHPRLVRTDGTTALDKGLTLFSCHDETPRFTLGSFGLTKKVGDRLLPDNFRHEQYLMIEENGKRVLLSGCSHRGVLNVVEWFRPDVLIGGFHFSKLPLDGTLTAYAEYLNSFDTEYYTCHCTGTEQFHFMKRTMTDLHGLSCGQSVVIE